MDASPPPAKRVRLESPFPPPNEFLCSVCCDDHPSAVFRLRCNHSFCKSCWQWYVVTKVRDEGQCTFRCMQNGCPTVVDSPAIAKLVEPAVNERCARALSRCPHLAHSPDAHDVDGFLCLGTRNLFADHTSGRDRTSASARIQAARRPCRARPPSAPHSRRRCRRSHAARGTSSASGAGSTRTTGRTCVSLSRYG